MEDQCTKCGSQLLTIEMDGHHLCRNCLPRAGTRLYPKKDDLVDSFGGVDPPAEEILVKDINVHGREEHEALLRDTKKMHELGLDPIYEKIVYLRRWGSWLNGSQNYIGTIDEEKSADA